MLAIISTIVLFNTYEAKFTSVNFLLECRPTWSPSIFRAIIDGNSRSICISAADDIVINVKIKGLVETRSQGSLRDTKWG